VLTLERNVVVIDNLPAHKVSLRPWSDRSARRHPPLPAPILTHL